MKNLRKFIHKVKLKRLFLICILFVAITVPALLPNKGVFFNPITHSIFDLSQEDDVLVTLHGGADGWKVTLTGNEREEAIEIINNMRYYFYLPSIDLFLPNGGWDQCFLLEFSDKSDRYVISDNYIKVGFLDVYGYTSEMMALFEKYRPTN